MHLCIVLCVNNNVEVHVDICVSPAYMRPSRVIVSMYSRLVSYFPVKHCPQLDGKCKFFKYTVCSMRIMSKVIFIAVRPNEKFHGISFFSIPSSPSLFLFPFETEKFFFET